VSESLGWLITLAAVVWTVVVLAYSRNASRKG
jgi:hypothetical protein